MKAQTTKPTLALINTQLQLGPQPGHDLSPTASAVFRPGHWPVATSHSSAFTLLELLTVMAIIVILVSLLIPAAAKTKAKAHSASCINNLKQLQAAYYQYTQEHNDSLPPNISRRDETGFDKVNLPGSWVLGNAQIDPDATNIQAGVIYQYAKSPRIYHCPADKSTVRDRPSLLRTRNYSISLWLNVDIINFGNADTVTTSSYNKHKLSDLVDPSPGSTWVLLDENPLSLDDGVFHIGQGPSQFASWSSYRGDQHNNGANLSFADGHVEHYRWRCRRSFPLMTDSWVPTLNGEDGADLANLQQGVPRYIQIQNDK